MQVKVVTAPFQDTIVNVEQRLWMEDYLQKQRDAALLQPQPEKKPVASSGNGSGSGGSRSGSPAPGVPEQKKETKAEASRRKTQEAMIEAGLQEPLPVPEPAPVIPKKTELKRTVGSGKNKIHLTDAQVQMRADNEALIEKYRRRFPRLLTSIGLRPGMNFDPAVTEEQALGIADKEKGAVLDLSSLPQRSDGQVHRGLL